MNMETLRRNTVSLMDWQDALYVVCYRAQQGILHKIDLALLLGEVQARNILDFN